jgi:L-glyceraldehyde 3-phosphate reductase
VDEHRLGQARALNGIAQARGQSLAQMALAWVLRDSAVTSALAGTSRVEQLKHNVATIHKLDFSVEELADIEKILAA